MKNKTKRRLKDLENSVFELIQDVGMITGKTALDIHVHFDEVEKIEPETIELNKWHKGTDEALVYTLNEDINNLEAYGFDVKGDWRGIFKGWRVLGSLIPATASEVQSALEKEAVKRGFVKGAKVKSLYNGRILPLSGNPTGIDETTNVCFYDETTDCLWMNFEKQTMKTENCLVYEKGHFATVMESVKEETEKTINWNNPQLLVSDFNEEAVYHYDGNDSDKNHVKIFSIYPALGCFPSISKSILKPFKGTITINP